MQDLIDEINVLRGMRAETVRQIQEIDDMLAERETKLKAQLGTHSVGERRKYMRDHRPDGMLAVPAVMALDAVRESPTFVAVVASGVAVGLAAAICLAAPIAGDRPPRAAPRPPSDSTPAAPPQSLPRPDAAPPVSIRPPRPVPAPFKPAQPQTVDLKPVRAVRVVTRDTASLSATRETINRPSCVVRVVVLDLRVRLKCR